MGSDLPGHNELTFLDEMTFHQHGSLCDLFQGPGSHCFHAGRRHPISRVGGLKP